MVNFIILVVLALLAMGLLIGGSRRWQAKRGEGVLPMLAGIGLAAMTVGWIAPKLLDDSNSLNTAALRAELPQERAVAAPAEREKTRVAQALAEASERDRNVELILFVDW